MMKFGEMVAVRVIDGQRILVDLVSAPDRTGPMPIEVVAALDRVVEDMLASGNYDDCRADVAKLLGVIDIRRSAILGMHDLTFGQRWRLWSEVLSLPIATINLERSKKRAAATRARLAKAKKTNTTSDRTRVIIERHAEAERRKNSKFTPNSIAKNIQPAVKKDLESAGLRVLEPDAIAKRIRYAGRRDLGPFE